jgi:hypothetical protein
VKVLCSNGHNNADDVKFCSACGTNTFQPGSTGGMIVAQVQMAKQATTNGMAIAAMVLGICWVYWIGSILALVFGYVARRQIKERGQNGDGMAIAGIVLGWIGVASLIVVIIIAISTSA